MIKVKNLQRGIIMTAHDLLVLVTLLSPGLLLSIIIMVTFAAGG
ncbi:hypothetical protein [Anabaena sp. AL93]|jgi:hypothetical protein|nr:hypothetical protein [Anabaena sp. AL93]